MLPGSPEVLYLLIRNLLENSIRNVPVGGHVGLEIRSTSRGVRLRVLDDGPGIPPAERTRVFERFYRVAGSATGGSGLGLSIVQRIVEILSGTIELSTPAGGSGLTVTISLPPAGLVAANQPAA